jgi:hypothetical protein
MDPQTTPMPEMANPQPAGPQVGPGAEAVEARYARESARLGQSLPLGVAAGALAAAGSAVAWAWITAITEYQIGFMALAVGLVVGLAVRAAGRGVDAAFRLTGAALAGLGCLGGNFLAGCIFIARAHQVGVLRVLEVVDPTLAQNLLTAMFSPMDLLFYGLAIYEGWHLSVASR